MRTLTQVRDPKPGPRAIPPTAPARQEDAIKTSSLLTLATCHNAEIQSSAIKLLCNRFYSSPAARKALIKDLHSKDDEVKHRAQLAFDLLCETGVWREYSAPPTTPRGSWRLLGQREWGLRRETAERDVRRRRREAVVIHEGDGAVGREDVYMRGANWQEARPNFERNISEELLNDLLREQ